MSDQTKKLADEALNGCIATRLRMATRMVTRRYDEALRPLGLTVSQMGLLALAARNGILRQSDVTALLQLDDSTLSRNLLRMRSNGWLEEVVDGDARVHSHRLTAAGRALFEQVMPAWRVAQRQARSLLGDQGIRALARFAKQQGFDG